MLSVQQQNFIKFKVPNKKYNPSFTSKENNYPDKILDKSMLALATLGLATLTGCSIDDSYETNSVNKIEQAKTATAHISSKSATPHNTLEYIDAIFNALGMTDKNTSVKNINTMCNIDNFGEKHYLKLTGKSDIEITGNGMSLLKDFTAGEVYVFSAKISEDGGIKVFKKYDDGTVENLNYVIDEDGVVTEYQVLDNNFKIKKSEYYKNKDGLPERIYPNGEKVTYNTLLNIQYPIAVLFDAVVDDFETAECK